MEKEVCRQEHYRKWLTTQNVLNSMRDSDIRATKYSDIPSHDKRAAYGGYPRSHDSENHDQNATPDLAAQIMGGMIMTIMITIMTVAIVVLK